MEKMSLRTTNYELRTDGGRGLFITFEGIERCGKGTQLELLHKHLAKEGHDVITTREPGATTAGQIIRQALLDPGLKEMDVRTEALLFAANRAEHVEKVIRPALVEGKIVLCDRYTDSSLAYQSFGRGLSFDEVLRLSQWATGGLEPNLTIFLKIPVEVALQRLSSRKKDRIEEEDRQFHQRVAQGFDKLSQMYRQRYRVVDGTKDRLQIHQEIVKHVEELL